MKYTFTCQHCTVIAESDKPFKAGYDHARADENKQQLEEQRKKIAQWNEEKEEFQKTYNSFRPEYVAEVLRKGGWFERDMMYRDLFDYDSFMLEHHEDLWRKNLRYGYYPIATLSSYKAQPTCYIECPVCECKNYFFDPDNEAEAEEHETTKEEK